MDSGFAGAVSGGAGQRVVLHVDCRETSKMAAKMAKSRSARVDSRHQALYLHKRMRNGAGEPDDAKRTCSRYDAGTQS